MSATATVRRYVCVICGKPDIAERMVYSQHTGNRFCPDMVACERRAWRKAKA